jgi:hypothetical protein
MLWYVILNRDNLILAVYGSALLDMAEAKRDELSKRGSVELCTLRGERPRVGQAASLSEGE